MLWSAKSLNGWNATLLWLVKIDAAVVWVVTWQAAQPMLTNWFEPWTVALLLAAGAGGAERRMKPAKLTMSDEKSDAGLLLLRVFSSAVASSGVGLKTQPCVSSRSLLKSSLVTPCSTL